MQANWYNRMHRLSAAQAALIPLANDQRKFNDPQNSSVIRKNLKELSEASAELAQDPSGPKDPIINHTARIFAQDMAFAEQLYASGRTQQPQALIANSANYCISCHTRADRGTRDFPLPWNMDLKALTTSQKTQFYLANRQYAAAKKEAEQLASSPKEVKSDVAAWRTVLERTLAMLVRVENNPQAATQLATAIHLNPAVPYYVRYDAYVWLRDIGEWQKDMQVHKKPRTDKQKYKMAEGLIAQAQAKKKPQSHSGIISSLRASALLHEVIENPKATNYADALYSAGLVSELLMDISVWSLNQSYYEACIRARPHTYLAEQCYMRLEASIMETAPPALLNPSLAALQKTRLEDLSAMALSVDRNMEIMFRNMDRRDSTNFGGGRGGSL